MNDITVNNGYRIDRVSEVAGVRRRRVVGQASRYMGWIKQRRADHEGVGVRGIIVAHEATDRLRSAVLPHPTISLYTYQFSVALAPVVATVQQDKSKVSC